MAKIKVCKLCGVKFYKKEEKMSQYDYECCSSCNRIAANEGLEIDTTGHQAVVISDIRKHKPEYTFNK